MRCKRNRARPRRREPSCCHIPAMERLKRTHTHAHTHTCVNGGVLPSQSWLGWWEGREAVVGDPGEKAEPKPLLTALTGVSHLLVCWWRYCGNASTITCQRQALDLHHFSSLFCFHFSFWLQNHFVSPSTDPGKNNRYTF